MTIRARPEDNSLDQGCPKGRFCAVGSRRKPGAAGAPLRAMESGWLEGDEEEGTQCVLLGPAGSAWPPCPTAVAEVWGTQVIS